MTRYLLIVARDQLSLCEYLTRAFSSDEQVQVLLDRRRGERRQLPQAHAPERRRGERRAQQGIGRGALGAPVTIFRLERAIVSDIPALPRSARARILIIDDDLGFENSCRRCK